MPRTEIPRNTRTPLQNLAAALRQLFVAAVVLCAAGLAAWLYALSRADGEIRVCLEEKFAECCADSGLRVEVESARRLEGRGIEVRGVKIVERASRTLLLEIDELFLICDTDWQQLLSKQVTVRHVDVRRPSLHVIRAADGGWNVQRLLRIKVPPASSTVPTVTIDGGRLEIRDERNTSGKSFLLNDVHVDVKPVVTSDERTASDIGSSELKVTGMLAGASFRRGDFTAAVNCADGGWSVQSSLADVELSAALVATLPAEIATRLAPFAGVQGRAQLQWSVARADATAAVTFAIDGELEDTRLDDPRLPAPLTEIQAQFHADHERLKIDGLTARCGPATLWLALDAAGYADDSPLTLQIKARQFEINQALVDSLPASLQTVWSRFSPKGKVNADATLAFDGHEWRPDVVLQCLDLSFAYHRFPYRLTAGQGFLNLHDGVLTAGNFRALANDRVVRFDGEVRQPGDDFTGWIEIRSVDKIALDDKLLAALDERQGRILRALQPRGEFTFASRFSRTDPQAAVDRRIDFGLEDCSVRYVGFPYPLEKVRGKLHYANGQWQFENLHGQNDSAYVECKGTWTAERDGGQLSLEFVATDVPLEDDLRDSLKPQMQRLWSSLRPTGTIDYVTATVNYDVASRVLSVDTTAQKRRPDQNVEGRTITMRPVWLPYQWDNLAGSIHYRNGQFEVRDLRAAHGRTSLSLSGDGRVATDGGWSMGISNLHVTRMNVDQELLTTMPGKLGQSLAKLNLTGPVSVQGKVDLQGSAAPESPLAATYDLNFDVENGSLNCGVRLDQIRGGVHLVGGLDSHGRLVGEGTLDVHSVFCRDVQLTQVRGPIRIEPTRIVFGDAWTGQPTKRRAPLPATAQVFGGSVAADAVVSLVDATWFDVQAVLTEADLGQMARDLMPQKRNVAGKASATVRMQGASGGMHTWRGGGNVHLHDADLYEVPVMLALLKLLSIRQPDSTGFTVCDVGFRLEGDRLYFDQIDFKGDAITLKGNGEMRLDKRINLEFYTMVGRDEFRLPLITPALAEASRQLMEIRVDGTLDDPHVEKKPVPVLNEALRQMFPELAARGDARAESRPPGTLLPRLPTPREVLERGGLAPKANGK